MNQRGTSLIEVLIGASVVLVVIMSLGNLMLNQQKMIRGIEQKQEAIELKSRMQETLTNRAVCTWQMKKATASNRIDVSSTTATVESPTVVEVGELYTGSSETSPGTVLAKAGQMMAGSQVQMTPARVVLRNILRRNLNEYEGNLQVEFDNGTLVRAIRPASMQIIFTTNSGDSDSAKRIESCGPATGGGGGPGPTPLCNSHYYCVYGGSVGIAPDYNCYLHCDPAGPPAAGAAMTCSAGGACTPRPSPCPYSAPASPTPGPGPYTMDILCSNLPNPP
jgi:hypothetical protein